MVVRGVTGEVAGRAPIIVDDMISTAGSICGAVEVCKRFGASDVYVAATHGVFCGPAIARLSKTP